MMSGYGPEEEDIGLSSHHPKNPLSHGSTRRKRSPARQKPQEDAHYQPPYEDMRPTLSYDQVYGKNADVYGRQAEQPSEDDPFTLNPNAPQNQKQDPNAAYSNRQSRRHGNKNEG